MAKYLPPMFARLYVSMIAALCASILLTLQFAENYLERSSVEDFVRDTSYIYQTLEKEWQQKNLTPDSYFKTLRLPYSHFDLQWLKEWDYSTPCDDCNYLSTVNNIPVYQIGDEVLLSVFPVPGSSGALKISDRLPLIIEDDVATTWYQDPEDMVPFSIFIVALFVIGGVLYYPARKLQYQIDELVKIHRLFGEGDLQIRANEKIPEPLDELAANFNTMANKLNNTVSESHVFAQAVPHEMRTPLSRIQLAAGLLRKSCHQQSQQELLDNIETYIDDLDDLTAQVMTYSRLNSANTPAEVDQEQWIIINDFISSRVTLLSQSSPIKVVLQIEQESNIICNPVHLRLLFDNLLKNALRYANSQVLVSVQSRDGQQLLIVEDDGLGILEENHQLIFIPFARLDKSRNCKTGGLGLGLAIAKTAATKLGGTLTVQHSQHGGAKFILSTTI